MTKAELIAALDQYEDGLDVMIQDDRKPSEGFVAVRVLCVGHYPAKVGFQPLIILTAEARFKE